MGRVSGRMLWLGLPVLLLSGCAPRSPGTRAPASRAATEKVFPTPTAAVDALVASCRSDDEAALAAIFGAEARPLLETGDPSANRDRCRRFVAAAGEQTRLDPRGADTLVLVVGADDWPFPIPLVKDGAGWRFDSARGAHEIVRRRIGADELQAIAFCRVYVRAQEEYASVPREGGVRQYAQRLVSTAGTKDGLYWRASAPGDASPLAREIAVAGDHPPGGRPLTSWWGYHFRVLTAQGKLAPGGARSYLTGGRMVGGFALVAYPEAYGSSGIMTFLVDRDGRVYQKDLGPRTDALVAAMREYNPDSTWTLVTN